jgi:hypothetical protein
MMPEKGSKGNLDPSRVTAPGDADTPVAGRDGPAVLPGSAGDGSWRSAVAGASDLAGGSLCSHKRAETYRQADTVP